MSGLGDALAGLASAAGPNATAGDTADRAGRYAAPKGWEPGVKYDPAGPMLVTTTAQSANMQADVQAWQDMVAELGLTVPDGWRVRLVEAKYDPAAWHRDEQFTAGGVKSPATTRPVWRYRFAVEPSLSTVSIDELLARVKRAKPAGRKPPAGERAFLVAMGDLQIGKQDGDGPAGTVDRVVASIDAQAARLKELRRAGRQVGTVHLAWLGDCVEGFTSQGGASAWRTSLTMTEQVRIVRRLMLHQVETFRPLAERIVLSSIPGNHDEPQRFGKAGITRYDDSWAVEAAIQVADALALNRPAYGHVSIVTPARDELTLTLDVAGTTVGLAHGHQMRPGRALSWWAEQAHGMQPIGEATVLLTGHLHHLVVNQGGPKTHIQTPAYEAESTWWRHRTGQVAPTGAVTLVVGGGTWADLAVL